MIKFICDRCDRSFDNKNNILTINYPVSQKYVSDIEDWPTKPIMLCNNCINALNDFMKPLPKQTNE